MRGQDVPVLIGYLRTKQSICALILKPAPERISQATNKKKRYGKLLPPEVTIKSEHNWYILKHEAVEVPE
jgi:hypothetical protein